MKKTICYVIIFLCVPMGILVTAFIRREPTYQSKGATVWFARMKMDQKSPSLSAFRKIGLPAVMLLQKELTSRRVDDRFKAAWALGQLGPSALDAAPSLIHALDDNSGLAMVSSTFAHDGLSMGIASGYVVFFCWFDLLSLIS